MIIADTSGLLAYFNKTEPTHEAVRRIVEAENEMLVVSPFVAAELDYLVATRIGVDAEIAILKELASGAWDVVCLTNEDLNSAAAIVERYSDQNIGLADASLVVLASKYRTRKLLTLDHRHFKVVRPLTDSGQFTLLP